jgi:HSP20 family protein
MGGTRESNGRSDSSEKGEVIMLALWNQFDELMNDDFFRGRRMNPTFAPAVDIHETKEGYELLADLPGLTANDVNLTVENGTLTVSGERKIEKKEEKDGYRRIERAHGTFRRSFTLPKGVDAESISAHVENGQLRVLVPKPVAELPRKIKVEATGSLPEGK